MLPGTGQTVLGAVVGSAQLGTLIYGTATELYVGHSRDGVVTADAPIEIEVAHSTEDVDGRVVVMWQTSGKKNIGRIMKPGDDGTDIELPEAAHASAPCLTNDRAWLQGDGALYAFGGGQPLLRKEVPWGTLQGCTHDAALYRELPHTGEEEFLAAEAAQNPDLHLDPSDKKRALYVCTDDCRKRAVPAGAPDDAAIAVFNGKIVALAAHGSVLGVWREGGAPVFYSMPEPARLVLAHELPAMAMTNGNAIDVIARGTKTFVLIRVPAT
jgi:hypothetical protein